ncbi:MAG TPA: hypothetical protein VF808_15100 [Ktedonobacterales bacterium]
MRTNDPCRIHAPVLAALHEYEELGLDLEAVDAARAHLVSCANCQERRHSWTRLDDAVRATMRAGAAPDFSTADLLAAIGADHEPRERRTPMLSVVRMKDVYDMDDETQHAPSLAQTSEAASAPTFAPLPSIKPASRQPTWRRALTGLVAVAAVVALVGGIAGAMSITGRLHGALGGHHINAVATQTAQGLTQPGGGAYYQIAALSMDSATDGWAVVVNEMSPTSTTILHITHGVAVKQATLPGGMSGPVTLQALSPTNVWLLFQTGGTGNFYHYDGIGWMQPILPAPANAQGNGVAVQAYNMVSPTEGWAIISYGVMQQFSPGTDGSVQKFAFYRYDGANWHIEPADQAATVAEVPGPGSSSTSYVGESIQISAISVAPGGDAWATGWIQVGDQNGNTTTWISYIYHHMAGAWHVAQVAKDYQYTGIVMASAGRGWIIGQRIKTTRIAVTTVPYTVTSQDPVVLAWDGARWAPAAIPPLTQSQLGMQFNQLVASSPSDAWLVGPSNNTTLSANKQYASDNTYLAHFDGARWSTVALPQIAAIKSSNDVVAVSQASFNVVATTPAGDLWLAGVLTNGTAPGDQSAPLFYYYANSQWTSLPLPNLK